MLTPEQLADPVRHAASYRIPLLNQIAVLGDPPAIARQRVVRGGRQFPAVRSGTPAARRPARYGSLGKLAAAGADWPGRVRQPLPPRISRRARSSAALTKLWCACSSCWNCPASAELSAARCGSCERLTGWSKVSWAKRSARPESPSRPELPVLETALAGWLNMLHKEAVRRADSHPVWAHIEKGFDGGLSELARERFQQGFRSFQLSLADEVERTARAIYEELERKPLVLNTLRSGNFALDVAAIAGAFTIGHLGAAGLRAGAAVGLDQACHLSNSWAGSTSIRSGSRFATARQLLVTQYVSGPLAEWLTQWPATGGSTFERLQARPAPHSRCRAATGYCRVAKNYHGRPTLGILAGKIRARRCRTGFPA